MNGVENMLYMRSVSGNDGSYTLNVYFAVGTNPDINTVNVQNRVSLAEPKIPSDVRQQGLTVKKQSPALLQMIAVYSPDGQRDALFLSNYGDHQRHRLAGAHPAASARRCSTASKTTACGSGSSDRRADEPRTSRRATSINAIQTQNVQAAVGRIGAATDAGDQELQLSLQTKGRL